MSPSILPAAQRRSIFLLATAAFASSATTRITDPILPQLAHEYDVSIAAVSLVATAYTFAYGFFQAFFGPVGDRFGKFRTILVVCIASALTTLACAFSTTLPGITLARFISGFTSAAIIPLSIAWIGDTVDYAERQPILAQFTSGQILGILGGQIGGGILGEYFGWRSAFYVLSGTYLLVTAGLLLEMRANAALANRPAVVTASWLQTWGAMARLFLDARVRFVLTAASMEACSIFGALTYVGVHLRSRFGLDYASVGLYLGSFAIGGFLYVIFARRLIDTFGQARLALYGAVIAAAGFLIIAVSPLVWPAGPATIMLGLGFYMIHNTLQVNATQMSPDARGSGIALFATCFFVAQAIGVFVFGIVIDNVGTEPLFVAAAALTLFVGYFIFSRLTTRYTP